MTVKIVSSLPGTGKTSWAIEKMNREGKDKRFLFVTPFVKEIERVVDACSNIGIKTPDEGRGGGRKKTDILNLLKNNENIATSHALFTAMDEGFINRIRGRGYTLILDESIELVSELNLYGGRGPYDEDSLSVILTREDMDYFCSRDILSVDPLDFAVSPSEERSLRLYRRVFNLAKMGLLYYINDSVLIYVFPPALFAENIFSEYFVLTYQFDLQLQKSYFDFFGIGYEKYYAFSNDNGGYSIAPGEYDERLFLKDLRDKIHIVESPYINEVGDPYVADNGHTYYSALSSTHYLNHFDEFSEQLKKNLTNFFGNITNSKVEDRMWTTFKAYRGKFSKTRHVPRKEGSFAPMNSRATNNYREKTIIAYLVNRYYRPHTKKFFETKGVVLNDDDLALSEMLQFLFRSSIREGRDIQVYMPSYRMRTILNTYLEFGSKFPDDFSVER